MASLLPEITMGLRASKINLKSIIRKNKNDSTREGLQEKMVADKMVYGQNGIRQNGTDKIVWTKWYG